MKKRDYDPKSAMQPKTLHANALPKHRPEMLQNAGKNSRKSHDWAGSYTGPVYLDWEGPR